MCHPKFNLKLLKQETRKISVNIFEIYEKNKEENSNKNCVRNEILYSREKMNQKQIKRKIQKKEIDFIKD